MTVEATLLMISGYLFVKNFFSFNSSDSCFLASEIREIFEQQRYNECLQYTGSHSINQVSCCDEDTKNPDLVQLALFWGNESTINAMHPLFKQTSTKEDDFQYLP